MISRREWLGTSLSTGAALALSPQLLRALERFGAMQQGTQTLLQRAIPSTGEKLPVIGLSFSNHPSCADHAALKAVVKTFADNGGTVFDAMHANGPSEQVHATLASELGIQNKVFWSARGTPPGGPGGPPPTGAAAARAQVETLLTRFNVPRVDLVMVNPMSDPAHLAVLKEMKAQGRIRYIGVQTIADGGYAALESVMRNEPIDFIGVDYDVGNRAGVEDTILPLAQERKIGVMAFFPFGNNGGFSCSGGSNLFARVGTRPLPEWASEFDAKSWAQFFLKYVIGHPAITVARVSTSKSAHMLDNMGGGIGRLPDEATRRRMAALIDALPPAPAPVPPQPVPQGPTVTLSAAILDRYVGEYQAASGFAMAIRRDGATLFAKPSSAPEGALAARSETRFTDARGPAIEFQLDGQGKVTGLIVIQGAQRTVLERK